MAFERIKTVKGHQYKYLVENVRENGKVKQKTVKYLGRVNKQREPSEINGATIPRGLYYFSQEGCGSCTDEAEVKAFLDEYSRRAGIQLPELHYINLSKTDNPTNITVISTPTIVESDNGKLFVYVGSGAHLHYLYLYKLGEERYNEISQAIHSEEKEARLLEIEEHIRNGKKYRELCSMGYDKEEIRISQGKPAKTEKELLKIQQEEERTRKAIEEWERKEKSSNCKDGACQVST